ncbi:MAG: hypothetical protein GY757_27970, partial [bacterium]|nr:hypothetical protein [bacterium]
RPIVIFSPVYGYDERNTWFIDDEVYLLNVAVSRAKDSFLVFGNMCIFDPLKNSPTGLLAKLLFADPSNELPGIMPLKRAGSKDVEHIKTVERHCFVLKRSLQKAESKVLIVSPFISINAIQYDNLDEEIRLAVLAGKEVIVYTDRDLDKKRDSDDLKGIANRGRKKLEELGVRLIIAQGIHNKTLCVDEVYHVEGSFNWLSSPRDPANPYYLHNASYSYKGDDVAEIIRDVTEQMEKLSQLGK